MGNVLFGVGVVVVVAGLAWRAIELRHRRQLAEIETAELELDDYVKLALAAITFAWQCPDCGTPLLTREAVQAHNGERSSCTGHLDRLEAEAAQEAAEAEAARWRAEQAPRPTLRKDPWPALGAEGAPGELETAP